MEEIKHMSLRDLDDIDCSNIVIIRNIHKFIKRYPNLNSINLNCRLHCGTYTKFLYKDGQLEWYASTKDPHYSYAEIIHGHEDFLDNEEINKLVVYTYRALCDSLNTEVDLVDTPEDILDQAEQKLKELIASES